MKGKRFISVICIILICTVNISTCFALDSAYDFSKELNDEEAKMTVTRGVFSSYLTYLLSEKGFTVDCENEEAFSDVNIDHPNYNDIMYLKKLSIISGVGNGEFRPDDNITYQDVATMISRVFLTDSDIIDKYGSYPAGYVTYALNMGLLQDVWAVVTNDITMDDLYIILNNLDNTIVTYDLMEKLGCDAYNGEVYIDYYPKSWQGYEEQPIATTNGYFRILPAKLLYSYDRENWNVLYEDIEGKRVYHNLPEEIDIDGARYAWEYSCFVNAPYDKEKEYYSYDNINWFKGSPPQNELSILELNKNEFVMGIEKESIIFDEDSGLYFSWQPYYEQSFYSNRYETVLQDVRCNMILVSTDAVKWVGISIPKDMLFFTGAGINESAKALIIDGAVEFTDDEKAFLDNEEKIASEQGLGYDKPWYKPEKYILRFSEIKKILE